MGGTLLAGSYLFNQRFEVGVSAEGVEVGKLKRLEGQLPNSVHISEPRYGELISTQVCGTKCQKEIVHCNAAMSRGQPLSKDRHRELEGGKCIFVVSPTPLEQAQVPVTGGGLGVVGTK